MRVYISDITSQLRELEREKKIAIGAVALTVFFILFSYPIVRSTTQALFLDAFKAKKTPLVQLYSVLVLTFSIAGFSWLQKRWSVQLLFVGTALFTAVFFWIGSFAFESGAKFWAYPLFIWKEVYIVVLFHMALAYLNNIIDEDLAKIIYGPMGAIGSLGGIVGGFLTSRLTEHISVAWILALGGAFILVAGFSFSFTLTSGRKVLEISKKPKESPLASIKNVKGYVLLIAVIIIFSQFCINLTDFKFNILLDQFHPDRADKVRYLGSFYSYIGMISFTVQILLIPLVLKRLQLSSIHRFIPICYLVVILLGFGLGGHLFLPVAASFALFKGVDYSLFAAAKELLYFPLSERQKYGAKYICDMLIYRMAKGLISFILIFVQAPFAINMMLFSCLVLWIIGLGPIFKMREKLLNVQEKL